MATNTITPQDRQLILLRDGGRCIRCGKNLANIPSSVHHRKPRGMGGTKRKDTPACGVSLCGTATTGCHNEVESHREHAREHGYLIPTNTATDPATVPIFTYSHGWAWLEDDATITATYNYDEHRPPTQTPTP